MYRTAHCGELTEEQVGKTVKLAGWVQKRRDLGGLIFIDLRDRSGIVQVVFNPEGSKQAMDIADKIRSEFVIELTGDVILRDKSSVNDKMATGRIEIAAKEVAILNKAKNPPFAIKDQPDTAEDVRLRYRYLDLRRPEMLETFKMRHKITKKLRDFLDDEAFLEIETPMLTKSTPEGARDYLVPSRVHPGEFYALPQSPQIFKQLLMVAGMEKYYQIVRCFRDEDLRADRQPEFTQVDIEMSFFEQEPFIAMIEKMMTELVAEIKGKSVEKPFQRMTYAEAMGRYGSDKPDTRFGMELIDLSTAVKGCGFKVFKQAIENSGQVKALNVEGQAAKYSRKMIDDLAAFISTYGAKGLAWLKVEGEGLKGPIAKFLEEEVSAAIIEKMGAKDGDLLLFCADSPKVVADSLGALRLKLGKELGLINEEALNFLWVTEFPLLSYDEEAGRYVAEHHPFTMPMAEDLKKLEMAPGEVRAQAYDLVLNGYELGGGSARIYQRDVQEKMFKALGFSKEEAEEQFGFLLEAFEYGTPPHGGVALGLDRLVMILAGRSNLRDTIAFPKTASASCLLTKAPSAVSDRQLEELQLKSTAGLKEVKADI
ncbi:aspartyl-tRNA synthetase [Scopulibacillus darangshiensis]|uniref:Aspartate--tRNA ligase n=1 Tax=Scopulibacillus darangshiensis TaxID=442528 RepID=A0A4R2PCZ7_9BACL|nr:aspartate--tRNA ligase [Scopulibacillus darangshiensis]TCP32274.1 aspartyl-tRNA synthetase [Scopulibacillus darangshiensis]